MAFPWNRSDAATQAPPAERRRRSRERRGRSAEARRQSARASQERDRQRLLIVVGATLILVIFAIVAVGYYREFYQPPRIMAGEIRGVRFKMGDLVQRIRVLQGIGRYTSGGRVDLSRVPFEYLQGLLHAEILRQASPGLGITITKDDIDQALREDFKPAVSPGQETDPGQVEKEFQENYKRFLTATGLSDKDYRVIVEERLAERQLFFLLGTNIPKTLEQVEVEWIRLDLEGGIVPTEVKKRLDTEDFAKVAAEVGRPDRFTNEEGYVGWIPQGTFPELDEVLFGSKKTEPPSSGGTGTTGDSQLSVRPKTEPLAVGAISDPVFTRGGVYLIRKKGGPEVRELSDLIRVKLNIELLTKWKNDQVERGAKEGWVRMNFDSNKYAWVAEQVRVSAPRVPPVPPQGQR